MSMRDILDRLAGLRVLKCGRKKEGCKVAKSLCMHRSEIDLVDTKGAIPIMPPHQALKILADAGWRLNTNPDLDRCPECIKAGFGIEDEPWFAKPEAAPLPVPAIIEASAIDPINDFFSRLNDFGALDWHANEDMFLACLTMMMSHVERFFADHYGNVSPSNQIALMQAAQALIGTVQRKTGLASLFEINADLNQRVHKQAAEINKLRNDIKDLVDVDVGRYKDNKLQHSQRQLENRDKEIADLKETLINANKTLISKNDQLIAELQARIEALESGKQGTLLHSRIQDPIDQFLDSLT